MKFKLVVSIFLTLINFNGKALAQYNQCELDEYAYNYKLCIISNSVDGGNNPEFLPYYGWLKNPFSTVKFRKLTMYPDASFKAEVNWKNQYNGYTDWLTASGFVENKFKGYFCCGTLKINVGDKSFSCDTRQFNMYTPTGSSICRMNTPLPPLIKK